MLRGLSIVAVPVLLATTTVLLLPPPPMTVVAAGPAQSPVVAVAAMGQLRVPAARTAVVIGVYAGATVVENEAQVAVMRRRVSHSGFHCIQSGRGPMPRNHRAR